VLEGIKRETKIDSAIEIMGDCTREVRCAGKAMKYRRMKEAVSKKPRNLIDYHLVLLLHLYLESNREGNPKSFSVLYTSVQRG
jgi:hypothetical protein